MDDIGKINMKMVSKNISCDICKKNIKSKSYLCIHKRIHSKDNPYNC